MLVPDFVSGWKGGRYLGDAGGGGDGSLRALRLRLRLRLRLGLGLGLRLERFEGFDVL
jgi:hypothetical protein